LKQKEEEFAVYEPYCANYTNASELMLMEEQNLVVRLIFTLSAQGLLGDRMRCGDCRVRIFNQMRINRNIIT
jgi:hypothetical protein